MTANQFIAKGVSELLEDGFSLRLQNTASIDGKYGGWFSSETKSKEFVVAMKRDAAFEIFVHEYSHYLQWKQRRQFFNAKSSGCAVIFNWLDGTEYSDRCIVNAFAKAIEIEWDCERIALSLIKKYKLPIDKEKYIRGANCYLFFYYAVQELRLWTSAGRSPYSARMRALASNKFHPLEYYLDVTNCDPAMGRAHKKLCTG
jgi:hypothetical protein